MEKKLFYSAIYLPFLPFFSLYSSIYLSFFLTFFLSLSSIYLSSFLIPPPTHSFKEQTSLSLWVCVSGSCRARTNEKPSSLVRRAYRSFYLPSYLALPKHWNWAVQIWIGLGSPVWISWQSGRFQNQRSEVWFQLSAIFYWKILFFWPLFVSFHKTNIAQILLMKKA